MSSSLNLENSDGGDDSMTYVVSGISFQSATPIEPAAPAIIYNFISFLAVTQHRQIDFLPIAWQPALDSIGLGGTSEIHQSIITLQAKFAFKRIKHSERARWRDGIIFRTLLSEITVLSHPSIRAHPNIVKLLGICWDILHEGSVLPVLVFEKAQFGNLREFSTSEPGKCMSLENKLKLCSGIATAIRDMHSCREYFQQPQLRRKIF
jgi:serine/threonine protein kinase